MPAPSPKAGAPSGAIDHPPGFRLRRGRNWFILGLTYASYYLCRYNLSPVAPELMADLKLDKSDYGLIKSARDLFYAVGQMVNGLLTDRLGGKKAMTIGAIGTIVMNLAFGVTAWSSIGSMVVALTAIRAADGYLQAFGAPGMIKINTAWFRRRERGAFAGIFGAMINLGAVGAGQLARLLSSGFALPIIALSVPHLNWRYMFIIPPVMVAIIVLLMNFTVKNQPEEAGFRIVHDDEAADDDPNERVKLGDVLRKIAGNRVVWLVAGAYFCTGFVRSAVEAWWAVYLKDVWNADRNSPLFSAFVWGLPVTATIGSMASGYVSDLLFGGRRAPVAALLYLAQAVLAFVALVMPHGETGASAWTAVCVVIAMSMMCNSTHSILGAAAAMDLGGRKMAGCSSGIIDSFQYYGAILSGWGLGKVYESLAASSGPSTASAPAGGLLSPTAWFGSMIPFGLAGAGLMTYVWWKHRGTDARGT